MRRLLVVIIFLAAANLAHAYSFAEGVPRIFASEGGGSAIFAMIPGKSDGDVVRESFGIAFRLLEDGTLKELYRTSGWYSNEVFVSADGRYLVATDYPTIDFFEDGKLIKRYSIAELIKNPESVPASAGYFGWLAVDRSGLSEEERDALRSRLDLSNRFTVHTIDGWTYQFDATTGKITATIRTKR